MVPATSSRNCCGVPPTGVNPARCSAALASGSRKTALISPLSRVTISAGVAAGRNTPCQAPKSNSGKPSSFIVGTLGNPGLRVGVLIASARTVPAWIWPTAGGRVTNIICTWPAITSLIAEVAP